MTPNKKRFLSLVSKEKTNTLERNEERIRNRKHIRIAQKVALQVLNKLDELNWSKIELAHRMDIPITEVCKLVQGKESVHVYLRSKLKSVLNITIINQK